MAAAALVQTLQKAIKLQDHIGSNLQYKIGLLFEQCPVSVIHGPSAA